MTEPTKDQVQDKNGSLCPFAMGVCQKRYCALWISKPNPIDSKLDVGTCSFRQIACNMDTVSRKMLNLEHLQRLP